MSDYFLRSDPHISRAVEEAAWRSFLDALKASTPEVIAALKPKPLESLRALAEEYKKISSFEFGAFVLYDPPAMTAHPMGDLAQLIRSPEIEKPQNVWPPAAPFWESPVRGTVLELAATMRTWAANFLDTDKKPHLRILNAGLETMRTWTMEPETINEDHWWGSATVIARQGVQTPEAAITVKAWNPTEETELEFKARIKTLIKELNGWSKMCIRQGKSLFIKYETKRNPEHYDWAALRLVKEMTYPQIAEAWASRSAAENLNLDETTIRKGVRTTLKVLGLRDVRANRK